MTDSTLQSALEILNRRRHRNSDSWHIIPHLRKTQVRPDDGASSYAWLSEFEAVALAEKYLREEVSRSTEEPHPEDFCQQCGRPNMRVNTIIKSSFAQ